MTKSIRILAAVAVLAAAYTAPAPAQEWPAQPIKLIVPFGPGGGSDIVSRIVAQRLQEKLGQPVVVENRPGAGGIIGNDVVANAPKDGYTIGIMTAGQIIAAVMRKSMPYDTLTAFDPIAQVATASFLMVARPDFAASSVKELVAAAKAAPGKISFASPGYGATQHMAAVLFAQTAGIEVLHVPFRTSPEASAAVIGKRVDILFDTVSAAMGNVQSGQLKALAVTGKERFPAVPNVPTAMESGVAPGFDVTSWYGFFAPRGTPPAVIAKLNKNFNELIAEPAVRERLVKAGVVVEGSTAEAFGNFMASEHAKWAAVRDKAGLPQR